MKESFSEKPIVAGDFLSKVRDAVLENLSDEFFGVSELAEAVGMSRSNLLRKIKKETNLSASQYIRNIRLEQALHQLRNSSLNVSEVSFKVGFNSTSYFIKCFRERYGYPPGEAAKRLHENSTEGTLTRKKSRKAEIMVATFLTVALLFWYLSSGREDNTPPVLPEKSIAVLPFKNDSNDSSNLYFVNGLMESILGNLQKIEDIRVISRTSVEKYRYETKSIPEIARELQVGYFVEGSGQKVGDQIMLNIQLIDANSDQHLWAEQYNRKLDDIFQLQQEVAKNIAGNIEAVITPNEFEQIEKVPTENLEAYDLYLRGMDEIRKESREGLLAGIPLFEQAIELDSEFALAYAMLSISYYYLDIFQAEKTHTDEIRNNADKAILYDDKLAQSLLAKGLYHLHLSEHDLAVGFLERALEYNPNSSHIIQLLSEFYANYIPNTSKYLEYALKGVRLSAQTNDSIAASYSYLHLSVALSQAGFVEDALEYVNLSQSYMPQNTYAGYAKAYIVYAINQDLDQTTQMLEEELNKYPTRLDIMQEVAKVHYYQQNYEEAHKFYSQFTDIRDSLNLDIYSWEHIKIAFVLRKLGREDEAEKYVESFLKFAEVNPSQYKELNYVDYYLYRGDFETAMTHLEKFSEGDDFKYWLFLFMYKDPLIEPYMDNPQLKEVMDRIEEKFWKSHDLLEVKLKKEGLL